MMTAPTFLVGLLSSILLASASDGRPPVTIIEIPVTTTTTTAPATTTTTAPAEVAGTVVSVATTAPTVSAPSSPVMTPILVAGRWDWPLLAVIAAVLAALSFISLTLVRKVFGHETNVDGTDEDVEAEVGLH
jgi:hypothetical protein